MMLAELHEAPDDKALKAAEEVAQFRDDIADLKSTPRLHTWILSANTAGIMLLIGLALQHH